MSKNFTPTTERVRDRYIEHSRITGSTLGGPAEYGEAFDRWLAEHDRQVAKKAWWEGAEDERLNGSPVNPYYTSIENGAE